MAPPISTEHVRVVVADLLGHEVGRITRLAGSVANQDFVLDFAGEPRLVLKAGPEAEIATEAWACARLAGMGVPVPQLMAVELSSSRLGSPFLVVGFVAGEPTSDVDVVREAGSWFRRVHTQKMPGWGPVVVRSEAAELPGAAGRYSSWRDAVEADLAGLAELVAAGILPAELADRARKLVGALDYDGPGVLLHNDLKPAHLFGMNHRGRRRLSAVIDWGDARIGDPTADIARLSMSGHTVTAAFLDGYDVRLTDQLADRLARYRILWNVRALSYEYQAGGDWFDTYRNRISEDVGGLLD